MVAFSDILQNPADTFGLIFFIYTVMQFIIFSNSTVVDNVNILKLNVKLKDQFTAHFEKFSTSYIYEHSQF